MNIFKKKTKYEIVCDQASNLKVQDFAMKHGTEKSVIEVRVHGSLLQDDNLISVSFVTYERKDDIFNALRKEFKNYDLMWRRELIFVRQKKEEES